MEEHAVEGRRWSRVGWGTGAVMVVVALALKPFVGEPDWLGHLAQSGALLIGVGVAVDVASRRTGMAAYRAAVALAVGTAVLLGVANGAVGILGSEDNAANLMYGGVIAVGILGALVARFEPVGMSRALFLTALAQAVVAAIALLGRMGSGPVEIVTMNGFFVALFLGSAVLFSKATHGRSGPAAGRP